MIAAIHQFAQKQQCIPGCKMPSCAPHLCAKVTTPEGTSSLQMQQQVGGVTTTVIGTELFGYHF